MNNNPCLNCGLGTRSIEDIRKNNRLNYYCSLGKKYECDKKKKYDIKNNIGDKT